MAAPSDAMAGSGAAVRVMKEDEEYNVNASRVEDKNFRMGF